MPPNYHANLRWMASARVALDTPRLDAESPGGLPLFVPSTLNPYSLAKNVMRNHHINRSIPRLRCSLGGSDFILEIIEGLSNVGGYLLKCLHNWLAVVEHHSGLHVAFNVDIPNLSL